MKNKGFKYLISLIVIIGLVVLFLFPEPETNFLAYLATGLFFVLLVSILVFFKRRKKK